MNRDLAKKLRRLRMKYNKEMNAKPPTVPDDDESRGNDKNGPIIVFLGAPCSGKGTQSQILCERFGMMHISTGEVFRDAVNRDTKLGREVSKYLETRTMVPPEIAVRAVVERLGHKDVRKSGCILDGFPRTSKQVAGLLDAVDVTCVIVFEVSDEIVAKRAPGRVMDSSTGKIYSTFPGTSLTPPRGAKLKKRPGDSDAAFFQRRCEVYREQVRDVLEAFDEMGIEGPDGLDEGDPIPIFEIRADGAPESVTTRILTILSKEIEDFNPEPPQLCRLKSTEVEFHADVVDKGHVSLSVCTPERPSIRTPLDVCCAIDLSGSMGKEATFDDESGNGTVGGGQSILNIVKHGVRTVMNLLRPEDRMSLVVFNGSAKTRYGLDYMTPENKAVLDATLKELRACGRTNIWDAIHEGLEGLNIGVSGRRSVLMLLTDGMPNVRPSKGELYMLRQYISKHRDFNFQINTFGFGYKLDSNLLCNLAREGHGTFTFIPNACVVGTVFVHSLSNAVATLAQKCEIRVEPLHDDVVLQGVSTGDDGSTTIDLSPLQFGQTRSTVVRVKPLEHYSDGPHLRVTTLTVLPTGVVHRESRNITLNNATKKRSSRVDLWRTAVIDKIKVVLASMKGATSMRTTALTTRLKTLRRQMCALGRKIKSSEEKESKELAASVTGRVAKAMHGYERFLRWGRHYLIAFSRALELQQSTNEKDEALSSFGGALFKETRDLGKKIFLKMEMPKKDIVKKNTTSTTATRTFRTVTTAPATYYGGGGCFGESCTVSLESGENIGVNQVRRGDRVRVVTKRGTQDFVEVKCAVHIETTIPVDLSVLPGGVVLSSKHPTRRLGETLYTQPIRMTQCVKKSKTTLFNFVLDRPECALIINNRYECLTFAHGHVDSDIVKHEFYGTHRVVDSLKQCSNDWSKPLCVRAVCDKSSDRVIRFCCVGSDFRK